MKRSLLAAAVIRKPPRPEATVVRLGDTVSLAGWSPASMRRQPFQVTHGVRVGVVVAKGSLKGAVQVFGTTKVTRDVYSPITSSSD